MNDHQTPPVAQDIRAQLWEWGERLRGSAAHELVEGLRALEELRNVVSGVQLDAVAALAHAQHREDLDEGVDEEGAGACTAGMVGLARRESPHRAAGALSLAARLQDDLPVTRKELLAGRATEYQAQLMATHTSYLSRKHRLAVDATVAPRIEQLSPRRLANEIKRVAYAKDPRASVEQVGRAHHERRVTMRPQPDTMTLLTASVPAVQGVAAWASLDREAAARKATGDERSLDQLRADILIERLTGQASAHLVPVEVQLVVPVGTVFGEALVHEAARASDRAPQDDHGPGAVTPVGPLATPTVSAEGSVGQLDTRALELLLGRAQRFADEKAPAFLSGYGPLPAPEARQIVRRAPAARLRRLLADPFTGSVIGRESRSRTFSPADRDLLVARDQFCRTPWCDAPIREADHVTPWAEGGPTSLVNGQGLCTRCNQAKNHPRWYAEPVAAEPVAADALTGPAVDQQQSVTTTTPTGHRYTSPVPTPYASWDERNPASWDERTPAPSDERTRAPWGRMTVPPARRRPLP
ncbi:DUF222 domain-containing protein [Kytococcus sedentarius]|uniref:HNH endonuclease n=1 Tax=Kytococcus sedentarius TaxID=1276 RepID=UPI0035BBAC70